MGTYKYVLTYNTIVCLHAHVCVHGLGYIHVDGFCEAGMDEVIGQAMDIGSGTCGGMILGVGMGHMCVPSARVIVVMCEAWAQLR